MAVPFLVFVAVYAGALMVASVVILTGPGRDLILRGMGWVGTHADFGPWNLSAAGSIDPRIAAMPLPTRARLAEGYVAEAEQRTLEAARVVLWVLIGGCVASALAAIIIVAVLPPLVVRGVWTYETYRGVAQGVVTITAIGGLLMGLGLIVWIFRRVFKVTCTEGCASTKSLVSLVRKSGVTAELAHELSLGSYPRLRRLLHDMV